MTVQTANKTPTNQPSGIEAMYYQMMFHLSEYDRLCNEGKEDQPETVAHYERHESIKAGILTAPAQTAKDAVLKTAFTAIEVYETYDRNYPALISVLLSTAETACKEAGIDDSADIRRAA